MTVTAPQINLLTKRKKKFDQQSAASLKAKVWSGTVLVAYAVIMVIILAINVFLSQKEKSTEEALDRAKMTLSANAVVIGQNEKVVTRAKTIETVLSDRRESIKLWQQLQQILPLGTELTSFALEGNVLSAGITSPNVLYANQVIDMVEKDIPGIGVNKTMVDISRGDDASYVLKLVFTLHSVGKTGKS